MTAVDVILWINFWMKITHFSLTSIGCVNHFNKCGVAVKSSKTKFCGKCRNVFRTKKALEDHECKGPPEVTRSTTTSKSKTNNTAVETTADAADALKCLQQIQQQQAPPQISQLSRVVLEGTCSFFVFWGSPLKTMSVSCQGYIIWPELPKWGRGKVTSCGIIYYCLPLVSFHYPKPDFSHTPQPFKTYMRNLQF